MRTHILVTLPLLAVLLLAACATKEPAAASPPEGVQQPAGEEVTLTTFYISLSSQYGLVPDELVVRDGAELLLKSYEGDARVVNEALGVDLALPQGEERPLTFRPGQPGTYTLSCVEGCPAEKSALTITVR